MLAKTHLEERFIEACCATRHQKSTTPFIISGKHSSMPKIHIHHATTNHIAHEPIAVLTELNNSLKSIQHTGDTLKLKRNDLTTTPGGVKNLVNHGRYRAEQSDASDYFGSTSEKISIREALRHVENAIRSKNERPRLIQDASSPPVTAHETTPSLRLAPTSFDETITREFLAHTNKNPTAEQLRVLNDLCTGLSILKARGISAILPSAGITQNGFAVSGKVLRVSTLAKSEFFKDFPKSFNSELLKLVNSTTPECSRPEGPAAATFFETVPSNTKAIMLELCLFAQTDLRSIDLNNVNLDGIRLWGKNLRTRVGEPQHRLQCSGSTWSHSQLRDMEINNSNFSRTTLTGAKLVKIQSEGVNYTGATLAGAKLIEVNFSGSNFTGADLTGVYIDRVNFSNANLTDAKISLNPDLLDDIARNIDTHINHLNNEHEGLLVSINSIDPKYEEQRNVLMRSVIERLDSLGDHRLAGSWDSLANVLLNDPSYTKDSVIAQFIQTRLLSKWMESKNQGLLRPDEINLVVVLDLLNASSSTVDWSAPRYQGAVNQLLHAATLAPNQKNLSPSAEQLRTTFLNNPTIKEASSVFDAIEDDLSKLTYIFAAGNGQKVLALEPELFENLVCANPKATPWKSAYLLTRNARTAHFETADLGNLKEVYAIQPFLKTRYAALMQSEIGTNLIRGVLGNSPHSTAFLEALNRNTSPSKLVANAQQDELYDAFSGRWQVVKGDVDDPQNTSRALQPEHQEQLWQAVNGLGLQDTRPNRAAVMLCLSSIFTRYSASALFGTETESPPAVRLYASALLNEARALDPSLIDNATATDWQARLLGIENAFTCTAILSSMMNSYLQDKAELNSVLETVLLGLYPAAWR
ncbi:pentapeptide repeat-containing protein [Pseudomonas corrugata]|uniref:pentapeptide repeat-containing protein n=1 Tax=Pseudomonas corrugata TaxID=47879 RepID=UPI00286BA89E|nr:pentapeptide repeat-containing protein [Pseudomonas corrugata]